MGDTSVVAYLPGASGRGSVLDAVANRLARRRAALLVDYPESGCGIRELARHVLGRLPERVDIVSLSMGSAVALHLALEHPERVRRLVLVTAAGGVDARRFGAVDWRPAFRERRPAVPYWFVEDDVDLTARLGSVIAPTLLVFGGRDLVAPVAVGEHLLAHLPNATLHVIPDATHDLEEEFPDLLASLIEAHLRR